MAIDKRLKIYDNQGNEVDYDIIATDVKFAGDGKDLPTKLAELEEEIGEGGYTPPAGGIPATDLAPSVQTSLGKADSAYQKPASGIPATDLASGVIPDVSGFATADDITDAINDLVDGAPAALDTLKELADALADEDDAVAALTSALAGKVDKNGTDSLMTAAEHTKLAGLPTSTELGNTYATKTELADKVDKETGKGLSSNDYTTAEKTKLAGLPTGSELNTALGNKANSADVYSKTDADGRFQAKLVKGTNLDATPQNGSDHPVTSGGVKTYVDTAIANVEAGEQIAFDAGGTAIIDNMESLNADTILGAASARVVKEIYDNLKALYSTVSGLANIAFVGTRPTWQTVAKRTYTLSYDTLTGCTADVQAGSVNEGYLKIVFTPTQSSYAFTSVLVNGESVTPTSTGESDGSVYIEITVSGNVAVSATAISGYAVELASGSHCSLSPASVTPNGTYRGTLSADQHYTLPSSISATMGGNAITFDGTTNSYNSSTGAIVIANVTGAVVITASADAMTPIVVTLNGTNVSFFHGSTELTGGSVSVYPDDYSVGNPYVIRMVADSGFSFTGAPTTTGVNSVTADGDDYLLNVDANETANFAITAAASMPTTLTLNTKWFQDPATTPTITAGSPFTLELTPLAGFVAAATQDAGTENAKDIRAAVQVLMNNVDITNDSGVVTFDVTNNKVAINIANPNGLVVINATARLRIKRGYGLMANNSDATDSNTCYTYDKIPFPAECKPVKTFYYGYGSSASMSYSALFYTNGTKSDDCGIRSGDYREYNPPSTCTHFRASVNLTKAQNAQETFPIIKAKVDGGNYVDIITHDDFVNALYANSF